MTVVAGARLAAGPRWRFLWRSWATSPLGRRGVGFLWRSWSAPALGGPGWGFCGDGGRRGHLGDAGRGFNGRRVGAGVIGRGGGSAGDGEAGRVSLGEPGRRWGDAASFGHLGAPTGRGEHRQAPAPRRRKAQMSERGMDGSARRAGSRVRFERMRDWMSSVTSQTLTFMPAIRRPPLSQNAMNSRVERSPR